MPAQRIFHLSARAVFRFPTPTILCRLAFKRYRCGRRRLHATRVTCASGDATPFGRAAWRRSGFAAKNARRGAAPAPQKLFCTPRALAPAGALRPSGCFDGLRLAGADGLRATCTLYRALCSMLCWRLTALLRTVAHIAISCRVSPAAASTTILRGAPAFLAASCFAICYVFVGSAVCICYAKLSARQIFCSRACHTSYGRQRGRRRAAWRRQALLTRLRIAVDLRVARGKRHLLTPAARISRATRHLFMRLCDMAVLTGHCWPRYERACLPATPAAILSLYAFAARRTGDAASRGVCLLLVGRRPRHRFLVLAPRCPVTTSRCGSIAWIVRLAASAVRRALARPAMLGTAPEELLHGGRKTWMNARAGAAALICGASDDIGAATSSSRCIFFSSLCFLHTFL